MRETLVACGHFRRTWFAYLMETHWPALKDTLPSGKLCGRKRTTEVRYSSKDARERVQERGRTAHIERVYRPIQLLNPDVFHGASPMDAFKDHLFRLGRTVSTSLQEAPVYHIDRGRANGEAM
jgi:hypothetical protein